MPSWLRREWYGSTSTNQHRWGENRRARTGSWESARTSDGAKSERWANFGETWPKGYWSRAHARCSWVSTWERTSEEWSHTRERVARWGCALCEEPDQRSPSWWFRESNHCCRDRWTRDRGPRRLEKAPRLDRAETMPRRHFPAGCHARHRTWSWELKISQAQGCPWRDREKWNDSSGWCSCGPARERPEARGRNRWTRRWMRW